MKNKIVFIVNPKSGVKTKNQLIDKINSILSSKNQPYEIIYTEYAGHGKEIAKELASQKTYMVVAVGGDGSVNEIASGLVHSSTILGIIPTGSGNGFAHHFNIPEKHELAIKILLNGEVNEIDVGVIDHEEYFFSNCGVAFDAEIAKAFELHPKRGFWTYVQLCVKHYFKYSSPTFSIQTDSRQFTISNALLVNVVNTSEFGNHFVVAPNANAQDGNLELLILKRPNLFVLPFVCLKFFFKTIRTSRFIEFIPIKEVNISNFSTIQKDGDWLQKKEKTVKIGIKNSSLKLIHSRVD